MTFTALYLILLAMCGQRWWGAMWRRWRKKEPIAPPQTTVIEIEPQAFKAAVEELLVADPAVVRASVVLPFVPATPPSPLRAVQQGETVERALGVSIENIVLLKMFWKAVTGIDPEAIDAQSSQDLLEQRLAGFMQGKTVIEEVAGLSLQQITLLRMVWEGFSLGSVEDITREQLERAVVEIGGAKLELQFRRPKGALPPPVTEPPPAA